MISNALPMGARLYILNINGSQGIPFKDWFSFPWRKAEEGQKTVNVKTPSNQTVLPKVLTGSTNLDELGGLEKLFCRALNISESLLLLIEGSIRWFNDSGSNFHVTQVYSGAVGGCGLFPDRKVAKATPGAGNWHQKSWMDADFALERRALFWLIFFQNTEAYWSWKPLEAGKSLMLHKRVEVCGKSPALTFQDLVIRSERSLGRVEILEDFGANGQLARIQ